MEKLLLSDQILFHTTNTELHTATHNYTQLHSTTHHYTHNTAHLPQKKNEEDKKKKMMMKKKLGEVESS